MKTKLIIVITLFALLVTTSVNAQGFNWAIGVGSSGDDIVMTQKTDNSGNHYICGYFSGPSITFGNFILNNANGNDFLPDLYLVKYDANWNVLWAYTPENDSNAYGDIYNALDLDIDNSGNCYLTGSFRISTITFDNITLNNTNPGGEFDPFIVKFDANGTVLWAKNFGGIYRDKARAVAVDPSGSSVYLAGWFYSDTINIEGVSFVNQDNTTNTSDIFLVKYDASGNLVWAQTNGSDNIDHYQDISVDNQGNIIATGTFKGTQIIFGNKTLTNFNLYFNDAFLVKYSPAGTVSWVVHYKGVMNETPTRLYVDQNTGNIYMGGIFNSSILMTDGESSLNNYGQGNGTYDGFLVKYLPDGRRYFILGLGGDSDETVTDITLDNDENVYVTGSFKSDYLFIQPSVVANNSGVSGSSDMFVLKINKVSMFQWIKTASGNADDIGVSLSNDDTDILVFGQSNANISFNNIALTNQGGYDLFMARLSEEMNVFSGRVYYDANNNGHMDLDDIGVSNLVLQIGDDYYLSGEDGNYEILLPAGNYTLVPQPNDLFNATPDNIDISFSGTGEISSDNNIALHSIVDSAYLETSVMSVPSARKGQEFITYLSVRNVGTVPLDSTTVSLPQNENLIYLYSDPPEDGINNDSVYWYVYDLNPFETRTISVHRKVDTILTNEKQQDLQNRDINNIWICWFWWACYPRLIYINCYYVDDCYEVSDPNTGEPTTQCDSVPVTDPVTGDTTGYVTDSILHCDYYYWPFCWWNMLCIQINFPHDPNEIYVSPNDTLPFTPHQVETRYPLEYTIRFQNTGNDTCFNAVVIDTLDNNLDVSTFEMLGASHNYNVSITQRVITFTFNNILLPDSTTNEPASHGYIKYRIKSNTNLVIGDSICNRADIYFDYEPPVLTNVVVTKIAEPNGTDEYYPNNKGKNKVKIAPNPFTNTTTVYLPASVTGNSTFVLYDLSGRIVKEFTIGKTKTFSFSKGNLKNGMYIYMLKSNNIIIDKGKMIIK